MISTESIWNDPRTSALLLGRGWHIDPVWGLSVLGKFLTNMHLSQGDENRVKIFEAIKNTYAPAILNAQGAQIEVGPGALIAGRAVPPGSILRLNLIGAMMANGDICTWGMDDYEQAIMAAQDNPNINGIFIRANTGGGEALAGQILHNAIRSSKKAVVVYADTLGSAGVLGTVAADEIIMSGPGSRIGSIGAYFSIDKEFLSWYAENVVDVYADGSEDKNAEFRALLSGDASPMKKVATEYANIFKAEVKKHRELRGDIESTLRGGMFVAREGKARGLADSIGDLPYAMRRMQANIENRKSKSK